MEMRNIKLVDPSTKEEFEIELQTYRVPEGVDRVLMNVGGASSLPATLGEKMRVYVEETCIQLVEVAQKSGQGEEMVSFLLALERDPDLPVPKQFAKRLRQDLACLGDFMRRGQRDPQSLIRGCLVGTDHGLLLQLWVLEESLQLYSNIVTGVRPVVEPHNEEVEEEGDLVEASEDLLEEEGDLVEEELETSPEEGQGSEPAAAPVEIILIHPATKPVIVMRRDGSIPHQAVLQPSAEEPAAAAAAVTRTVAVTPPHQSSGSLMDQLSRCCRFR